MSGTKMNWPQAADNTVNNLCVLLSMILLAALFVFLCRGCVCDKTCEPNNVKSCGMVIECQDHVKETKP